MKAIRDDAPIRPEANARAAQEAFEQTVL
jgi:hypothetical protein